MSYVRWDAQMRKGDVVCRQGLGPIPYLPRNCSQLRDRMKAGNSEQFLPVVRLAKQHKGRA
jgi:hypothetical protein